MNQGSGATFLGAWALIVVALALGVLAANDGKISQPHKDKTLGKGKKVPNFSATNQLDELWKSETHLPMNLTILLSDRAYNPIGYRSFKPVRRAKSENTFAFLRQRFCQLKRRQFSPPRCDVEQRQVMSFGVRNYALNIQLRLVLKYYYCSGSTIYDVEVSNDRAVLREKETASDSRHCVNRHDGRLDSLDYVPRIDFAWRTGGASVRVGDCFFVDRYFRSLTWATFFHRLQDLDI
jgi:hypothetical protein